MPTGKDKVPTSKDWSLVSKSRLTRVHHFHELPVCDSGRHDPSCKEHGMEVSCVKIIKSPLPLTYGASCVHIFS